jgi:hypothetical protein
MCECYGLIFASTAVISRIVRDFRASPALAVWAVCNLDQTHIQELSSIAVTQRPTAPYFRQP